MSTLTPTEHLLALNENPFGPLPSVRRALADAAEQVNRYPEFLPGRLPRLIAARIGVDPDRVVVGGGITGVAMHILQAFVPPGGRVVMASPTFDGYPIMTAMVDGECVGVPLTVDGRHDLPAMSDAVGDCAGLVVLCSPHNPTGTRIPAEDLEWFLRGVDRSTPVLLDEAYIEFVGRTDRPDIAAILDRHPNVIVLRTFSKAFGLAALRVGYAVGAVELISRIKHWQVPFEMNALAEIGVEASYRADAELLSRVDQIAAERDALAAGLRDLGFDVPHSSANCVFITYRGQAQKLAVASALALARIQVKYCGTGVRITVGEREDTRAVLAALAVASRMGTVP